MKHNPENILSFHTSELNAAVFKTRRELNPAVFTTRKQT